MLDTERDWFTVRRMTTTRQTLRDQLLLKAATKFASVDQALIGQVPSSIYNKQTLVSKGSAPKDAGSLFLDVQRSSKGTVIRLPRSLNLRDLSEWNDALWQEANAKSIDFDFTSTKFFTPLNLLFIPHQIREFHRLHPEIRLHAIGYNHLTYPAHMGFFDCFGGQHGKLVGEAPGDKNYLPINVINVSQFIRENGFSNVRDAIDSETKRLARVLVRANAGYAFDVVQYSLREIIRNVFEHSDSKLCMYCAQYWPTTNRVQLCIADSGMGIHPSLTFNPKFKHLSEREAVHFSLFPGVSGNFKDLALSETGSIWRNSGYGLYMASRMCRNNGGFLMLSSGHALQLTKGRKAVTPIRNLKGTMIVMDLTIESEANLSNKLEGYAAEGKLIARDIQGAKVIEASAASQMLSRDFAKAR